MREFLVYCRRLLLPLGLGLAVLLPQQMYPEAFSMDGWSALLMAVGGPAVRESNQILSLLMGLIPTAAFLAVITDFFRQDFIIAYVYVFTRFGRKTTWFFRRLGKLTGVVFVYVFCRYGLAAATVLAFGNRFSGTALDTVLTAFSLEFLFYLFLAVLVGCVSLPLGESKAFVCVLLLTAGSILPALGQPHAPYLLPFANGQLFWHDGLLLPEAIGKLECVIPGFTPIKSILSEAAMLLCTVAVSGYAIVKKDLLTLIGGE